MTAISILAALYFFILEAWHNYCTVDPTDGPTRVSDGHLNTSRDDHVLLSGTVSPVLYELLLYSRLGCVLYAPSANELLE